MAAGLWRLRGRDGGLGAEYVQTVQPRKDSGWFSFRAEWLLGLGESVWPLPSRSHCALRVVPHGEAALGVVWGSWSPTRPVTCASTTKTPHSLGFSSETGVTGPWPGG